MKKLSQILAVAVIVLAPFAASSVAGATTYTCQIGYTGSESSNICTSTVEQVCTYVNSTTVTINNGNDQLAVSGNGLNVGDTTVGSSTSGSATNSNGTTFNVTITKTGVESNTCVAQVTVPATPVTPVVTPTTPVVTTKAAPKVLPNTSSNTLTNYIVVLAATLGVGAIASFLFTKVYSRK